MRKELPAELRQLGDSLGPEFVNPALPGEAADVIETLTAALGSAKIVLMNRSNAGVAEWEALARAAMVDIESALKST